MRLVGPVFRKLWAVMGGGFPRLRILAVAHLKFFFFFFDSGNGMIILRGLVSCIPLYYKITISSLQGWQHE
jgi:hypothetical protein